MLGLDDGCFGELFLECGEDFDAFDRVDAEVGVEPHGGLEHLGGIAGLLRHDRQQCFLHGGATRSLPASACREGRGGRAAARPPRGEEIDDVGERLEYAEVLGLDDGCVGELFLEGGEDFDAFDRVDAEVGVEPHGGLEHLRGISGLLGHDRQQGLLYAQLARGLVLRPSVREAAGAVLHERGGRGNTPALRHEGSGSWSTPALASMRGEGLGVARDSMPSEARTSFCCCSSRVWKVRWVRSCPSRNCRCSWAVCSPSFWRDDQVLLGRAQGLRQQGGIARAKRPESVNRACGAAECPCSWVAPFGPCPCPVRGRGSPLPLAGATVGLREPARMLWVSSVRTHPCSNSRRSSAWGNVNGRRGGGGIRPADLDRQARLAGRRAWATAW